MKTHLGTPGYAAPEIYFGKNYHGKSIDLFAATVLLFIMKGRRPPFMTAIPSDPFYGLLLKKKDDFWKFHHK